MSFCFVLGVGFGHMALGILVQPGIKQLVSPPPPRGSREKVGFKTIKNLFRESHSTKAERILGANSNKVNFTDEKSQRA